jgi:hypothetical protein
VGLWYPNLVMFSYSHTSGPKAVVAYEKEFMTPCTDVYRSPQSLIIIALSPDATRHQRAASVGQGNVVRRQHDLVISSLKPGTNATSFADPAIFLFLFEPADSYSLFTTPHIQLQTPP